jgi:hypothetical protein
MTLERQAVRKQDVLAVFSAFRNQKAVAAVQALPERNGFLDSQAIDRLLLAVHWEMQRLAEEFFHGHRVRELLEVVILTIRANGFRGPLRIVDVGSGIGYVIRWIAARTSLPAQGVELVGMDLNSTLVPKLTASLPRKVFRAGSFRATLFPATTVAKSISRPE